MQCFSTTSSLPIIIGQTSSASEQRLRRDADVADVGRPAEGKYVFPVGGQEKRILSSGGDGDCGSDGDDGDGAGHFEGRLGHKNACLNENVFLSPLPQLQRLFCVLLLEPRPFSSYRSTKGLVSRSRTQKSRFRFAKGERILHSYRPSYS